MKLKDGGEVHADVLVGADGIWSQAREGACRLWLRVPPAWTHGDDLIPVGKAGVCSVHMRFAIRILHAMLIKRHAAVFDSVPSAAPRLPA